MSRWVRRLGARGRSLMAHAARSGGDAALRRLATALVISCVGSLATGCGKKQEPEWPSERLPEGMTESGLARCEFEGRDDRASEENSAPGAKYPNVRRVYGYIGVGVDRRKILLCREVDTNLDGKKDLVRTYGDLGEKLVEQADTDYDGKIDTWISFSGPRPSKIEIDRTGDGKPDEFRYYVDGNLVRLQFDENGDGRPDVFEIYHEGRLDRRGVDVDHDGHVDRWERDQLRILADEAAERAKRAEAEAAEPEATEGSGTGEALGTDAPPPGE